MTIFSNRDLERVAALQANWRKELLLEFIRLRTERHNADRREFSPSTEAAGTRSSPDGSRAGSRPEVERPRN